VSGKKQHIQFRILNKHLIILFSFLFLIVIASCKEKNKSSLTKNKEQTHWTYDGETSPEHWAEIEKNSDCDGKSQSPINIIVDHTTPVNNVDDLKIFYTPQTVISKVKNNGHSIQFDFEPGDSIRYKKEIYHLKQIHFHEPAEHIINGIRYPIEIHFVHKSDTNNLTVLSIFGEEGEISSLFNFFETFLPIKNGESKIIDQKVDLTSLYPKSTGFYSYSGSLTTPPCTENVNWVIFKDQLILSYTQALLLKANMPLNNYRNEQPLHDRVVQYHYEN